MVILVMGYPASGKSTLSAAYADAGFVCLNRDTEGGKVIHLLPKMVQALRAGKDVVLDNLFATADRRAPFIKVAKDAGVEIRCAWMGTSIVDAQLNALFRMHRKHKRFFFHPSDLKSIPKDPGTFPVSVLFTYRKEFEKPTTGEGFSTITKVPFSRIWPDFPRKAVLLDYDGTLRETVGGEYKFPTSPDQIRIMDHRTEKLSEMVEDGYILLGVSNQSGVATGQLTTAKADECFAATNEMLGHDIHVEYCPHGVPPTCFCRKPQSGLGVKLIMEFMLSAPECVMVGDRTADKTFAKRLGMQYYDQSKFF